MLASERVQAVREGGLGGRGHALVKRGQGVEMGEGQPGHCSGSETVKGDILFIFIMRERWSCFKRALYKTVSVSVSCNVSHAISGAHKLCLNTSHKLETGKDIEIPHAWVS